VGQVSEEKLSTNFVTEMKNEQKNGKMNLFVWFGKEQKP